MQVFGSEDTVDLYEVSRPDLQRHDVDVGRLLLYFSSITAGAALLPALIKKKRTYFLITPTVSVSVSNEDTGVDDPHLATPRCTPSQKAAVQELFSTIADSSYPQLMWNAFHLNALGEEIEPIHPFSLFLDMPKEKIRQIFLSQDSFKISQITGGIQRGMQRAIASGKIEPYLPSFSSEMGKDADRIRQLIQVADWRGLVRYLFDIAV